MIKKLSVNNYTLFDNAEFDFSNGLNIIIGENGTGKTQLLKIIYTVLSTSFSLNKSSSKQLRTKLSSELIEVTRAERVGRLVKRDSEQCKISLEFNDSEKNISFLFSKNSKEVTIEKQPQSWIDKAPTFIHSRELLSIYPGFVSLYEGHYLEFEKTLKDSCILLGAPVLRRSQEKSINKLLKPLEELMGGKLILSNNGRFYITLKGKETLEIPLVSEGIRKIAEVARFIETGALFNGYLFWDMPECSLNQKFLKHIAKTLIDLTKQNTQIFISTHSLFLMREFHMLQKIEKDLNVKWFGLTKDKTGDVKVQSGKSFYDIDGNVSLAEELEQYRRDVIIDLKR